MSKAKDRARAKSGTIFRDGKFVNAEEWYAAHPTREMLAEQLADVAEAVGQEMAAKFPPTPEERAAAGAPPFDYVCTQCNGRTHRHGSKVHEAHQAFAAVT